MDDKSMQVYKEKIKGLNPTELTDILSHINKDKFPEKYAAVEAEIARRSGKSIPKADVTPPEVKIETPKVKEVTPPEPKENKPPMISLRQSKASFSDEKAPAPPIKSFAKTPTASPPRETPVTSRSGSLLSGILNVLSTTLILLGVYVLLIAFMDIPGAPAIRETLANISPHFF